MKNQIMKIQIVKKSIKKSLTILPLLTFLTTASFAQLTTTGVETPLNYSTFVPPSAGGSFVDPVFGATIKRVTNAMGTVNADQGGNLMWIENEYSTMSAFNSDNSKFILVHQSYFGLYDGDGTFLYNLPLEISSSSEPRWSRTNNGVLYYHYANQLKTYTVATGALAVVHSFTEYSAISGTGESDISADGDHFVFVGDGNQIFVYQISTGKKFTVFNTGSTRFDSTYITPDNEVIVSWLTSGTTRYTGQELFDINMNFLRQLSRADGHKHLTTDTNGDEVLIWTNSDDPTPIANCQNGIVKIRLADATETCLLQLSWSLAVHITAPDGNGTAFVDTEAPSNPQPGTSAWVPYTNELLQVKLDGSGTTRWAHHRSFPVNSYNWQPKLTISRDGTHMLYASDFDLSQIDGNPTEYGDTYMIVFPASKATTGTSGTGSSGTGGTGTGTGTSSPTGSGTTTGTSTGTTTGTSTPTTTTTTVVYQQDSSAVTYSGTWYPNSGAFNSGGSATMAMDAGSQAKLTFTGTAVKWVGFSDPWSGIAQVYVDGTLVTTIDTYAATQAAQATQYSISGLSNGAHTLTIAATGNHNAQSGGSWVWVDAFDVTQVSTAAAAVSHGGRCEANCQSPLNLIFNGNVVGR